MEWPWEWPWGVARGGGLDGIRASIFLSDLFLFVDRTSQTRVEELLQMATIRCSDSSGSLRSDRIFPDIQAILFDKDGTLADSAAYLRGVGQKRARLIDAQIPGVQDPLLMAFGFEDDRQLNPAGLLAIGSRQDTEIVAAGYVAETGRGWLESLALVRSAFEEAEQTWSNKAEATPLFAGAQRLLQELRRGGRGDRHPLRRHPSQHRSLRPTLRSRSLGAAHPRGGSISGQTGPPSLSPRL